MQYYSTTLHYTHPLCLCGLERAYFMKEGICSQLGFAAVTLFHCKKQVQNNMLCSQVLTVKHMILNRTKKDIQENRYGEFRK